jgi:hypothetical protein
MYIRDRCIEARIIGKTEDTWATEDEVLWGGRHETEKFS